MKKICPVCKREFEAIVPWKRFDSNACKQLDYRNRKALAEFEAIVPWDTNASKQAEQPKPTKTAGK